MKRRLKINGLIMSITVLLIAAFPAIFLRRSGIGYFDEMAEILGVALILGGQIFRASARGFKAAYSHNGQTLIQSGPYALVRNPMYLGILLVGLGVLLILFNWWVICIFLVIFIIRYIVLIFKEEKKLGILFPQAYQDYCAKVPRILPPLPALLKRDVSEYLPLKLSWLKRETGSILAVLFITLFLESWEDIRTDGMRVYFKEALAIMITIILFISLVLYLSKRTSEPIKDVSNKGKTDL